MRTISSCIFIFLFLLLSNNINAQARLGVRAGFNFSTLINASSTDLILLGNRLFFNFNAGFHIGITGEIPISQKIYLESGVTFIRKGFPYDIVFSDPGGQGTLIIYDNFNALEMPLFVKAYVEIPDIKFDIFVGPTISYGFIETGIANRLINENGILSSSGNGRNLDYGLQFGAGVTINNINIGMFYNLGLANSNLAFPNSKKSVKNTVSGISLKYLFKRKSKQSDSK